MNAGVKELPDYHVAYVRKMGPYDTGTQHAVSQLLQWAGPRGYLNSSPVFVVYWDNPEVTPPAKCRLDACISVPAGTPPEGQIGLQLLRGGPYALCHFEIQADHFPQAWEDAYMWLVNSGYESDNRPCYELYHNNAMEHPEGKWIFDICIPLKYM